MTDTQKFHRMVQSSVVTLLTVAAVELDQETLASLTSRPYATSHRIAEGIDDE